MDGLLELIAAYGFTSNTLARGKV
ncbi:hypothetical protein PLUA15_10027 [Pseudomonas lundensis]|uniref:Uncharacterized protein n=1 Tax=Pseudomonas lundensis TaxID=86185 RepID=A0AAX2H2Z1_9PSED|nr:hypothetical protein PLUA15_10027 [Pseudomonas lundensis]